MVDAAPHGAELVASEPAGNDSRAKAAQAPVDLFDKMWKVNVRGPWLTLQKALPVLSKDASVIFNTSAVNTKGAPGTSAYASTKAALRSIVRTAASELSGGGIRVNSIAPGPIETPIYGKLGMSSEEVKGMSEGFIAQVPLARFGQADEIASVGSFLAQSRQRLGAYSWNSVLMGAPGLMGSRHVPLSSSHRLSQMSGPPVPPGRSGAGKPGR